MSNLFAPLRLNAKHELKNRLAASPLTTTQSNPDGSISNQEAAWLERLASDDYGLVLTCCTAFSVDSIAYENQLSFASNLPLDDLSALAKRMKKHNSVNLVQLCHAGNRSIKSTPYSASPFTMPQIPGFVTPLELSAKQIFKIVAEFATACARVEEAGFDGVEFHGANGYLFTQFFTPMTNFREDNYGGSLENRARFAREVVRACRRVVSPDFILGFRISFQNAGAFRGLDIDENIQIANWIIEDGIDYVHMSSLDYTLKSIKYPERNALEYVRENLNKSVPLTAGGGITSLAGAEEVLKLGADIITLGRPAIGNKDIPKLFAEGKEYPNKTPYKEAALKELGISQNFINYLRTMPVASLNVVES